eukprot:337822-Rhodomonas_salina.1
MLSAFRSFSILDESSAVESDGKAKMPTGSTDVSGVDAVVYRLSILPQKLSVVLHPVPPAYSRANSAGSASRYALLFDAIRKRCAALTSVATRTGNRASMGPPTVLAARLRTSSTIALLHRATDDGGQSRCGTRIAATGLLHGHAQRCVVHADVD